MALLDVEILAGSDPAPIDYALIELGRCEDFPHDAVREILALESAEIIRILDAVVIRTSDGEHEGIELRALPRTHPLAALADHCHPVLTDGDLSRLAESVTADRCALALVFVQTWAGELASGLAEAGASLRARGPIFRPDLARSLRRDDATMLTPRRLGRPAVIAHSPPRAPGPAPPPPPPGD